MPEQKELLLGILKSARGKALSVDEVLRRGSIDVGAKRQVHHTLRAMTREGLAIQDGRRYRAGASAPATPVPSAKKERTRPAVEEAPKVQRSVLPPSPRPGSRE